MNPSAPAPPGAPFDSTARTPVFRRASWGVADQAVASLSNFTLLVFVAQSVEPEAFGAFSAAMITFTLVAGLSQALTAEVFAVAYGAATRAERREPLADAAGCAFGLGLLAGATLLLASFVTTGPIQGPLRAIALVVPAILVQDFWRFAFFAGDRPGAALANDLVWAAVQIIGFSVLLTIREPAAEAWVFAWGAGGLLAAMVGTFQAGIAPNPLRAVSWVKAHRSLGVRFAAEWIAVSGASLGVPSVLGFVSGYAELAKFRGAQALFGPLQALANGIRLSVIPLAVRRRRESLARLGSFTVIATAIVLSFAVAWAIGVLLLPASVGAWLLGASWAGAREVLVPIAVAQVFATASFGFLIALRATATAQRSLNARAWTGALSLSFGAVGAVLADASGTASAVALASAFGAGLHAWHLRRVLQDPSTPIERPEPRRFAGRGTDISDGVASEWPRNLDYVIIGAQRCRSTFLNDSLREHPDAFAPRGELAYFEDPHYDERNRRALDAMFRAAPPTSVKGFKRADLLARSECPARIARDCPDARILVVLREPLARTVSAFFHAIRTNVLEPMPLNDGLRQMLSGERSETIGQGTGLLTDGRYALHLRRYLDHLDPSSMSVVLDDDLDTAHDETMRRVYEFVGLDARYSPRTGRVNEGVYSLDRLRLLRWGTRALYRVDDRGRVAALHTGIAARAWNRGIYLVDGLLFAPLARNEAPVLDDDVRKLLIERFEPEVADLEKILGRSLAAWRSRWAEAGT